MRKLAAVTRTAMLAIMLIAGSAHATPSALPGVQMIEVEDYAGAKAYFDAALRNDRNDKQALTGMVKLALAEDDTKSAVAWATRAVATAPNDADCRLLLGYAYSRRIQHVGLFGKIGMAHKISAAFKQGAKLAPGSADAHADLASFYIHAPGIVGGSYAEARQQIALLQPLDPVRANALLAEIAGQQGHMAEAERDMRRAAAIDHRGNGDYYLGMFLVSQHRYADARAAFAQGINENPANSRNYYEAGRVAALAKTRAQDGIDALKAYLAMPHRWQPDTPSYKWARLQLGKLYALAGDPDAAKAQYRDALAMDPDFAPASTALNAM